MSRRWTPAEDDTIIRGVLARKTDAQIADELTDRTEGQVSVRLHFIRSKHPKLPNRKAGRQYPERRKPKGAPKPLPPDTLVSDVHRLMRTLTDQQLGERLGYGAEIIRKFRQKHGLKKPKGGFKNQRWGAAGDALPTIAPTELPTYVDEQGRTIKKCPPGFAYGVAPQRSVGSKE